MIFLVFAVGGLLAAGAGLTGIILGTHPAVIAGEVFGCIAVPVFLFVAVSLTDHLVRRTIHRRRLIPQVRAAIGQQLRTELEMPRSLPPELATLLTQLAHA
jgi:hypothetical protein